MSRRAPEQGGGTYRPLDRSGQRRQRSRTRRRRAALGVVKLVFWALVLAGVFVLGVGYGRILGDETDATERTVKVEQEPRTNEATLPTTTVTRTVTVPAKAAKPAASKRAATTPRG